jgi:hypothetical protein
MLRSLRPVLVRFAAVCGLVALAAGCGSFSATPAPSGGSPSAVHPYEPDASDASYAVTPEPSESAAVSAPQGNPLCNAALYVGGCYPDLPTTAQACGVVADAGEGDGDHASSASSDQPLACHVESTGDAGDAGVGPECEPAGPGVDGTPCLHGTDCSAGYECVQNVCRHYCCAGNTSCALGDFCDVQPTTDAPGTPVPVCMPLAPCILLDNGACPTGQSCAVVRSDGTTSCETVGSAVQGDSCDAQHCAAGLVCLGAVGARKCYTLCYTATMAPCSAGQLCTGGLPLFPDPAVGWCQ